MKVKLTLPPFLKLYFATGLMMGLCLLSSRAAAQSPVTISGDAGSVATIRDKAAPASPEGGNVYTILMSNKDPSYFPADLVIQVGDVVRWQNSEKADAHSIHERSGRMISPDVAAGQRWCYRFMREGEYSYTCRFHPWMKGRIVVRAKDLDFREFALPAAFTTVATSIKGLGGELWVYGGNALWPISNDDGPGAVITFSKQKLNPLSMTSSNTLLVFNEETKKFCLYDLRTHTFRSVSDRQFNFSAGTEAMSNSGELIFFDNTTEGFVSINVQSGKLNQLGRVTLSSRPWKTLMTGTGLGRLWCIEQSRSTIASVDLDSGLVKEYSLAPGADLSNIAASSSGVVWLTDAGRNKVIKVENGWLTEYTIPSSFSSPKGLSVAADGGIWFTESAASKIGLLLDGRFEEYSTPTAGQPVSLRIDSQGNLWFVDQKLGKLGLLLAETMRRLSSTLAERVDQPCASPDQSPALQPKTDSSQDSHTRSSRLTPGRVEKNVDSHRHNQN